MASSSKLTVENIRELGGTEDDLILLEGVDSDSASDLELTEFGSQSVSHHEIQDFIRSIGIRKGGGVKEKGEEGAGKERRRVVPSLGSATEEVGGTHVSSRVEEQLLAIVSRAHKRLLVPVDTGERWWEQALTSEPAQPASVAVLDHLKTVGAGLMAHEAKLYEQVRERRKGASDVRWLKTVLSSGTLSDKMAALTLLIQESPVHTLFSLETLVTMATKKGKRESLMAVDTLKQLWLSDLLPDDRKLKTLRQRPLHQLLEGGVASCHRSLLLWWFEDQLKSIFATFLTTLQALSHDSVVNVREKAVGHIFDLLYRKPEQEGVLLDQLVNKLGDPSRKVASKATLFILKLLDHHINMKVIVAGEIESLLHRPNISPKAQYYGACCLNQFVIGAREEALAAKLIDIYFTFFKVYVKQGQLDAKMLGALLTGVNRAFPFLKGEIPSFEEHLHPLFKVVHVGPSATGIQALMLLYQVMESHQAVSARFYQALYSKLLDPSLRHAGRQAMFLNVLFKSLRSDPEANRVKAFLKRILQVCGSHSPPFICGCLFLVSELLKQKPSLWPFVLQPEEGEEHFTDVGECPTPSMKDPQRGRGYQPLQRNPLYCRAEQSCLWELATLCHHYHPSVQVFARQIASGEFIEYSGDPLEDYTLMRFLDRFVYRNPKQRESDHGGSLMQRASKLTASTRRQIPVNTAEFAAQEESKVRDDELFMHRYFREKAATEAQVKTKHKKKQKQKSEEEEGEREGEVHVEGSDTEMDFAGELERHAKVQRGRSKKRQREESEDSGEGEFDYDAMRDSDYEEEEVGEAAMERLLLENLSSSEGEGPEGEAPPTKRKRKQLKGEKTFDDSAMFAAADDFAHLLEESGNGRGERQRQWEEGRGRGNARKPRAPVKKKHRLRRK